MYARFHYVSKDNTFVVSIEPNNQSEVYAQIIYKVRRSQIVSVHCKNRCLTPSFFNYIISRFGILSLVYLIKCTSAGGGFYFDNDSQFM